MTTPRRSATAGPPLSEVIKAYLADKQTSLRPKSLSLAKYGGAFE